MAFNFGNNNGSTPNKPMFGGAANSGSNLFGGANNNTSTPGSSTPAATPSLFGSTAPAGSTLFGGASNTPAAPKSLFGTTQATTGASQAASSPFGFNKPADNAGAAAKPSLFGGAGTTATPGSGTGATAGFTFGKPAESSTPAATPAPNKTFTLPSTTPAGPPPGNSLFGQTGAGAGASSGLSLFGAKPTSTPGNAGPFSFGNKDTAQDANKGASTQPSIPGGEAGPQATPKPLFNLGSTTPAATPANKPSFGFGGAPTSGQTASSQPASNPTPAFTLGSNKSSPLTLGGDKSTPASTGATPSSTMNLLNIGGGAKPATPGAGVNFFTPPAPKDTTAGGTPSGTSGPGATSSLFGGLGAKPPQTPGATTGTTTSTPGTSSLFTNPSSSSGPPSTATTGTAAPSNSAFSLFNKGTTTSAPTSTPTGTASGPTGTSTATPATTSTAAPGSTTATSGDASKPGFASSTAGPLPSAQSRLKNKSMDEIITRWAADLSKYQKEFQAQASTVAKWDRALVENSDKVKQLYSKTFQAERDAQEVEKHLTHIENSQGELDFYLDKYEKEIDQMMEIHGVGGRADSLRGPDQERERTYKLAEKLQDRLNELNKDLTEMIDEINTTTQTLSKSGKPDDPLTKVVRVLNSQLVQLQNVEFGAQELLRRVDKAQKESGRGAAAGANGWNGLGSDPTDDFYRSYRGNRTERFGGVS